MIDDDYEKLKREIVFEKTAKAIKEDPKNWIKQLEDIGFEYCEVKNPNQIQSIFRNNSDSKD